MQVKCVMYKWKVVIQSGPYVANSGWFCGETQNRLRVGLLFRCRGRAPFLSKYWAGTSRSRLSQRRWRDSKRDIDEATKCCDQKQERVKHDRLDLQNLNVIGLGKALEG